MTTAERDELVRDLERAGVPIEAIERRHAGERGYFSGEWQIRCAWQDNPRAFYTIIDAQLFRGAVACGCVPKVPRSALDAGPLE